MRWTERRIAPLALDSPVRTGGWLRAVRPDVYLSPFYVLPFLAPCPCVLTLHDVWPQRLPGGLSAPRRFLHTLLMRRAARAARIVTSSEFSRREIDALTPIPGGRVRVVRLATPTPATHPDPRKPEGLPDAPFALVVGVNLPHKNFPAIAGLWSGDSPPAGLDLAWAGRRDPRHPGLAALATGSAAGRIRELGWVDAAGLEWLYANARMLLVPSRYEGFGFPLLEAFSRGLPVVSADIPVLREVGDGVAEFCGTDDLPAWRAAIAALASDDARRDDLRRRGRLRAGQYTYEATAEGVHRVLLEVAGGGR